MADERETCRIDGTHLQALVDISTPHQLAHVVSRQKPKASPPPAHTRSKVATGSQPLPPMCDDDTELTIEPDANDTSKPIDEIVAKPEPLQLPLPAPAAEQDPEPEPEPLPPPPTPVYHTKRDALLGGLIGLAVLAAVWFAVVSF